MLCGILTSCAERIAYGTEKTYNRIIYESWNGLIFCKYNPKEPVIKGEMNMRKRKWYERMSAAVLIAVLLVNHGDMGIMAKAETITALEENLEEENKKIEAETASASNADEKRDTTVDSNETTESDLEKETATASNGKENPATKRKMAKRAMNAETVTEETYSISQTDGKFKVVGGSLTEDGENLNSLTDAFNKILSFGTDTNININFDNVNISSGAPKLTKGCKLTLKGTYTSEVGAFIIGSNDTFIIHNEANIKTVKTGSYVIGRSSAPNSTVIFEQNGGTVESVDGFYMYENDVISLNGGTINGNARGNGGTGSIKIKDGTWNGQLAHIKDIDICGGQLNNIKDDTSTITAISESEEVSISGGKIYAKNTNSSGRAFAISMLDKTKLSLSGNIDISAEGGNTNGSIYYGSMTNSCATIDAVNLETINDSFKFVVSDLAMKASSSLKNWIKGSYTNMEKLVKGIHLSIVNHNSDSGYADQYQSYEARAVGNYIRIMDPKAESSLIPAGNIKSAEIQLPSDPEKYQVTITYDKTEDGTEKVETVKYTKAQVTVSGIIDEILLRNTGTDGLEISVGRTENPIDGDITVDSSNADDKPVLLKGKITGKVNVVGTGTLESEINCSGFNGETKSTIHITGGEIIGTVNADNANESVITLTSADLIVDGNAHIVDQSAYSSQNRYAISAIGGVSVTIKNGLIESTYNYLQYSS